jgi:hypothetical protein
MWYSIHFMHDITQPNTPEQNLDLFLARFTNLEPGIRQGRLYPELTSQGLVAVAMDAFAREPIISATVVVVTDEQVSVGRHTVHRTTGNAIGAVPYTSLVLGGRQKQPGGFSYDIHGNPADLPRDEQEELYQKQGRVYRALRNLAERGSAYDPLHTEYISRYPEAPAGRAHLYPNAGREYGARVNFLALLGSGAAPHLHPAVHEAAEQMPPSIDR